MAITLRQLHAYTMTGIDFRHSNFLGSEWMDHMAAALAEWMEDAIQALEADADNDVRLRKLKVLNREIPLVGAKATLPANFRHPVSVWVGVKKDDTECGKSFTEQLRPCLRLTEDAKGYRARDPFSAPSLKRPYYQIAGDEVLIRVAPSGETLPEGYTFPRIKLSYVRRPAPFVITCDEYGFIFDEDLSKDSLEALEDDHLYQIADLAVARMLRAKGDPRYAAANQSNGPQ